MVLQGLEICILPVALGTGKRTRVLSDVIFIVSEKVRLEGSVTNEDFVTGNTPELLNDGCHVKSWLRQFRLPSSNIMAGLYSMSTEMVGTEVAFWTHPTCKSFQLLPRRLRVISLLMNSQILFVLVILAAELAEVCSDSFVGNNVSVEVAYGSKRFLATRVWTDKEISALMHISYMTMQELDFSVTFVTILHWALVDWQFGF